MEKKQEYTELEKVLQRTITKQNKRISELTLDLDLAHAQVEIMKEMEAEKEDKNKQDDKKGAKK